MPLEYAMSARLWAGMWTLGSPVPQCKSSSGGNECQFLKLISLEVIKQFVNCPRRKRFQVFWKAQIEKKKKYQRKLN